MPLSDASADTSYVTRERESAGNVWRVTTRWSEIDGRMEPVSVEVAGDRVNGEAMKRLAFGGIIARHRKRLLASSEWFADHVDDVPATPQQRAAARRAFQRRASTLGASRGIALTPDGLEAVAKVYRDAYQRGEPVQAAVAEAFGIARSTAASRIGLARKAGLLPAHGRTR